MKKKLFSYYLVCSLVINPTLASATEIVVSSVPSEVEETSDSLELPSIDEQSPTHNISLNGDSKRIFDTLFKKELFSQHDLEYYIEQFTMNQQDIFIDNFIKGLPNPIFGYIGRSIGDSFEYSFDIAYIKSANKKEFSDWYAGLSVNYESTTVGSGDISNELSFNATNGDVGLPEKSTTSITFTRNAIDSTEYEFYLKPTMGMDFYDNVTPTESINYGGTTRKVNFYIKTEQLSIEAESKEIEINTDWNPIDNFISATNIDGESVNFDFSQISYEGNVDTGKAGVYPITYSIIHPDYPDLKKEITVDVTVKNNDQTSLEVQEKPIILYTDGEWDPAKGLVSATDKDGNPLTIDQLEVTGKVDITTPGTYTVTYKNGDLTKEVIVEIKENKASIKTKNYDIYVGETWQPSDNFDSATNRDNDALATFEDFENSGGTMEYQDASGNQLNEIDTNQAGIYTIIYKIDGVEETEALVIKPDQSSILVEGTTLYTSDQPWTEESTFIFTTNKDGGKLMFDEFISAGGKVEGKVDMTTPGNYLITYSLGDIEETIQVTVVQDQSSILVEGTTLYTSDKLWTEESTFIFATNKAGDKLTFDEFISAGGKVKGKVDMTTLGEYLITYSLGDIEETIQVTIVQDQSSIEGKDIELSLNDIWNPSMNFEFATNKDGGKMDYNEFISAGGDVEGKVDTKNPGKYQIVYRLGEIRCEAVVTIREAIVDLNNSQNNPVIENKDKETIQNLPQTGESNSLFTYVLGGIFVFGSILFALVKRKKNGSVEKFKNIKK